MNDFFTWEFLVTYAGAAIATGLITQALKKVFAKPPTQVLAYLIALIILLAGNFFTGSLTLSSAGLCLLNAVLVATSSSGTVDATRRLMQEKQSKSGPLA